mgnify:CR=1 FL=1
MHVNLKFIPINEMFCVHTEPKKKKKKYIYNKIFKENINFKTGENWKNEKGKEGKKNGCNI